MKPALPWTVAVASLAFALYTFVGVSPSKDIAGNTNRPSLSEPPVAHRAQPPTRVPTSDLATPHPLPSSPAVLPCTPEARDGTATVCSEPHPCPECPKLRNEPCPEGAHVRECETRLAQCLSWEPMIDSTVHSQSLATARRTTLQTLLQEDLQLSDPQLQWLNEAACALRELRWHAVEGIHGDLESDAPRLLIKGDRAEILADMEEMLGPNAYARFREMGGIGLLNDTLQCADQEAPL